MTDLVPWRLSRYDDEPPTRYHSLTPAAGWWVATWYEDGDDVGLWWAPVVVWAIVRGGKDDSDSVRALVQSEDSDELGPPERDSLGMWSETERADPALAGRLLADARERLSRRKAETRERDEVFAFVKAQADPARFAAQMRAAGCLSRRHAWLCIALANADAAVAVRLASERPATLEARLRRNAETRGAA